MTSFERKRVTDADRVIDSARTLVSFSVTAGQEKTAKTDFGSASNDTQVDRWVCSTSSGAAQTDGV